MVVNAQDGCTGGYTAAGGWTWPGAFDAASLSPAAFARAHCPSSTIPGIESVNTSFRLATASPSHSRSPT